MAANARLRYVERLAWGRVEIDFASCTAATLRHQSTRAGYGSASREVVRLVATAGTTCVDDFRPRTAGTWREHAPMPRERAASGRTRADISAATCHPKRGKPLLKNESFKRNEGELL